MTAKELDMMVKELRNHGDECPTRWQLERDLYNLADGLWACGKKSLALKVRELANEIDNIDTDELVEIGTFV